MLIFATSEEEVEPFLQMAYISSTVSPKVRDAIIPGQGGTVGTAIQISEPLLNTSPASDPELSMIETFKDCKAVLCLPLKAGDEAYGALLVGSDERDAFKDTHIEMMTILAKLSTAALDNARLYESLLIQRDRMVGIEKSARAQLASDLHDGPTQGIAAIAMRLNYIRKLIEKKPESAMSDLYQIEDMARRTSKEIRAMLFELRPKSLDEGLQAGLQALADKTKETYEQNVEIQVAKGIDEMLDDQSVQTFFSVAVEAINNARKHANASLITLRIYVQDDTLVYEIKDNGQGFDVDKALAESKKKEGHLGLFNLVERTAVVDGTLNIDSTPGEGTRITILVPVAVARQRKQDELLRRSSAAEAAAVGV
jgi:signal transduction histidine kinase